MNETQHGHLLLADISGYTCRACQNIPSLDLKFVLHHGNCNIQQVRDVKEMVGSDVNPLHRLLKNHVAESPGWRAYAMFTERCLEHMKLNLEDAHIQIESYEHFPEVKTYSPDLHTCYQELLEARRIFVDKAVRLAEEDFAKTKS